MPHMAWHRTPVSRAHRPRTCGPLGRFTRRGGSAGAALGRAGVGARASPRRRGPVGASSRCRRAGQRRRLGGRLQPGRWEHPHPAALHGALGRPGMVSRKGRGQSRPAHPAATDGTQLWGSWVRAAWRPPGGQAGIPGLETAPRTGRAARSRTHLPARRDGARRRQPPRRRGQLDARWLKPATRCDSVRRMLILAATPA
jgi:hypothetical protein